MTVDQYWAEVHQMGLTPTDVSSVFRARDGTTVYVDDPRLASPTQRAETIERLRFKVLGVEPVSKFQRDSGQAIQ
jgi:hypothetical protein